MTEAKNGNLYEETVAVPRATRFPVELRPPSGFRPEDPATWPNVVGRLEWVRGRLLYMPPCGMQQQVVAVDLVGTLWSWVRQHPEFVVGGNEAGMLLGKDVRGAEAAVYRREEVGTIDPRFARTPPVLVAEVAGREEGEAELREKARWYLGHSVAIVWIILPDTREVIVIRAEGESRHRGSEHLPAQPELPGLAVSPEDSFRQLGSERGT